MKKTILLILLAAITSSSPRAFADGNPKLNNLTLPQVDEVFKTFGAALSFRALEPASSYGKIWGISGGIIGGAVNAKGIKDTIPGAGNINWIPTGDIFVGAQAPLGLAFEGGFIPSISIGSAKLQKYGGNIRWTINEVFFTSLPLDVAVRAGYNTAKVSYDQTISGVLDKITYNSKQYSGQLMGSKKLWIFEPYMGLGLIKQSADLGNSGSVTLYNTTVSLSNTLSKDYSTFWFTGGMQVRVLFMTLSGQFDSMFGTQVYSAKLGFKI